MMELTREMVLYPGMWAVMDKSAAVRADGSAGSSAEIVREIIGNTGALGDLALRAVYGSQLLSGEPREIPPGDGQMEQLRSRLHRQHLHLLVIRPDTNSTALPRHEFRSKEQQDLAILNIIDATLQAETDFFWSFPHTNHTYVALFIRPHVSARAARETLLHLAARITDSLRQHVNVSASTCIGSSSTELSALGQRYEEAVKALDHMQFYGARTILFYQDFRKTKLQKSSASVDTLVAGLARCLELKEYGCFRERLHEYLRQTEAEQQLSEHEVKAFCLDVAFLLLQHKCQRAVSGDIAEGHETIPHETIRRMTSFRQISDWLKQQLDRWLESVTVVRQPHTEPIRQAFQYMMNHYDRELSLEQVAHKVHLNKSYLSELFKKETGMGFTDYLTRLRVEKAKEFILLGDCKISHLAERVGYPNGSYFTRVFKKITGMTPLRYKQTALRPKPFFEAGIDFENGDEMDNLAENQEKQNR